MVPTAIEIMTESMLELYAENNYWIGELKYSMLVASPIIAVWIEKDRG